MRNVLNLKSVKMITAMVLTILLVASLLPARAQAEEVKWYKGEPSYASDVRTKIGGKYFWYEYDYTEEGSTTSLYYSAKKSADGTKLVTIDDTYTFGDTIMFNGTKVYYTTMSDPYDPAAEGKVKIRICSVSKTGKNKKTVKTISVSDDCLNTKLLSVYNNRLYFTRYNLNWEGNVTEGKLYSMNLSGDSKTVKCHSNDFPYAESGAGGSRYIYAKEGNHKYWSNTDTLKIYDCKENKVVRSIKNVYKFTCSGSKLYYTAVDSETGSIKAVYSTSASGKDKKQILKFGGEYRYGNLFADSIYYYASEGGKYYKYILKDGSKKEIDEWEFLTSQGPMGM